MFVYTKCAPMHVEVFRNGFYIAIFMRFNPLPQNNRRSDTSKLKRDKKAPVRKEKRVVDGAIRFHGVDLWKPDLKTSNSTSSDFYKDEKYSPWNEKEKSEMSFKEFSLYCDSLDQKFHEKQKSNNANDEEATPPIDDDDNQCCKTCGSISVFTLCKHCYRDEEYIKVRNIFHVLFF